MGTETTVLAERVAQRLLGSRERFLGFVRRRIADEMLAEDVLQDSLLRAIQKAPELRDEERIVAWFYRILRNAVVDAYRRQGVAGRHSEALEAEPSVEALEPEEEAALCECFTELIPTLKREYADLIQSVELGPERPEEAARRLGISENNLKVRRHRARQALRKRLAEACRVCAVHHCLDCTCGLTTALSST